MKKNTHKSKPRAIAVNKNSIVLIAILLLAFFLRLYRIHYPLADWHSWRQGDTASVTREYIKHGIDLLHPKYQDLSSIPSGLDNSAEGYRMVEFPIVNAFIAQIIHWLPFLPLVATSRLFSILASVAAIYLLYLFTNKIYGQKIGLISALTMAVLPYSIYYSRTILPENFMVLFSMLSLVTFAKWLELHESKWYLISLISLMLAILLKPFVLFLGPIYIALILYFWGRSTFNKSFFNKKVLLLFYPFLAIIPFFWWRHWISAFPEGIPASNWLFNQDNIRFRPAWFRWLLYERLTKIFLGFFGTIFIALSVFRLTKPKLLVFLSWCVSIASYITVIAKGNIHHDYYQIISVPIICLGIALGAENLHYYFKNALKKLTNTKFLASFVVFIIYVGMLSFAWRYVSGFFNVNNWEYVRAGKYADTNLPANAKIIAPTPGGDTYFLFQTNRTGWPIGGMIDQKISQGATHYLSTTYDDEARDLEQKYFVIAKTQEFILIDLSKTKSEIVP